MAGIDIKGKAPKSTGALGDTYVMEIAGKKRDVTFYKVAEKFSSVMITQSYTD